MAHDAAETVYNQVTPDEIAVLRKAIATGMVALKESQAISRFAKSALSRDLTDLAGILDQMVEERKTAADKAKRYKRALVLLTEDESPSEVAFNVGATSK